MRDIYIWQKAKHIHRRQTHLLIREVLRKDYDRKGSAEKKVSDRNSQGAWHQDELTGSKNRQS
jgi:hypothetical protein